MKKGEFTIKRCHAEYTDKFLAVRDLHKDGNQQTYNLMAKWSCLVDLMTRLNNSILAEERRKKDDDNRKNQNR